MQLSSTLGIMLAHNAPKFGLKIGSTIATSAPANLKWNTKHVGGVYHTSLIIFEKMDEVEIHVPEEEH